MSIVLVNQNLPEAEYLQHVVSFDDSGCQNLGSLSRPFSASRPVPSHVVPPLTGRPADPAVTTCIWRTDGGSLFSGWQRDSCPSSALWRRLAVGRRRRRRRFRGLRSDTASRECGTFGGPRGSCGWSTGCYCPLGTCWCVMPSVCLYVCAPRALNCLFPSSCYPAWLWWPTYERLQWTIAMVFSETPCNYIYFIIFDYYSLFTFRVSHFTTPK